MQKAVDEVKLSIQVPDEWAKALRQAALDAGYKSVSEYARHVLSQAAGIPDLEKRSWGGSRQVKHLAQDEQDEQDAELDDKPRLNANNGVVRTFHPVPKPAQANKRAGVRYEDVEE